MAGIERKIYGFPIISAFVLLNDSRKSEPLFIYNKKNVHEFLYEKWKPKKDLFEESFSPEWDAPYPYFKNFEECIIYGTKTISTQSSTKDGIIKRVTPTDYYEDLKDIKLDSLKYLLEIVLEFDEKFGCDESGNKGFRTRKETIPKSKLLRFINSEALFKKCLLSVK